VRLSPESFGSAQPFAQRFSYSVPVDLLRRAVPDANLLAPTRASIPGSRRLPVWLLYDPVTRTFTVFNAPRNVLPLRVDIGVTTADGREVPVPILLGER